MANQIDLERDDLETAFAALGDVLTERGTPYEVVLIGGANLLLRGIITRSTKDGDLLGERLSDGSIAGFPLLPEALGRATKDVADAFGLVDDWVNSGPASLVEDGLPPGFADRLERRDFGGLVIWLAADYDMVCFKLYAATDHWPSPERHIEDLRALHPSDTELLSAARWCLERDTSPGFRTMLLALLHDLGLEDVDDQLA